MIDAMLQTAEDRRHIETGRNRRAAARGILMVNGELSGSHGAARVTEHAMLDALPPAPSVRFTFDGAAVEGRAGEPIAAALIAAGYRVFRTMPRFGDARGGYCMIGRCADCLVVVDGMPNVRACITVVSDGMAVQTQLGLGEVSATDAAKTRS